MSDVGSTEKRFLQLPEVVGTLRYLKTPEFVIGVSIALFFTITSFLGAYFIPYNPNAIDLTNSFMGPSMAHPFGTDYLGRDVLARTLLGGRVSIEVGLSAGLAVVVVGGIVGVLTGYFGGFLDIGVQRGVDIILAIPTIVFVLVLLSIFGSSILVVIVAVSALAWPSLARITRAETLSLKEREFIYAERLAGATSSHIIFRHVIPNEIGLFIVYSGLAISNAILIQAALAYLGFAGSSVSWGFDLYLAQQYINRGWWMMVFPGLALTLTSLGFYLMSEGLRRKLKT